MHDDIAKNSAHMEDLAQYLRQENYDVINIDYPSTDFSIEELVDYVFDTKDHIVIPSSHLFFPSNKEAHFQIAHFLEHGFLKKP